MNPFIELFWWSLAFVYYGLIVALFLGPLWMEKKK